jgi:hypothetical protein
MLYWRGERCEYLEGSCGLSKSSRELTESFSQKLHGYSQIRKFSRGILSFEILKMKKSGSLSRILIERK